MQFPIVQEYKTDIRQTNPENEVLDEPFKLEAGVYNRVIVPRHAPFFVKSLTLKHPSGEPMILDEDYEIFRIMPRLTELAAQPVACLITLKKTSIKAGTMSYHVVGEFPLVDSALLNLILEAVNDNRPVEWEGIMNKPSVFPPNLHKHSLLYDMVGFQDTIEFLGELQELIRQNDTDLTTTRLTHYMELVDWYIRVYGDMLDLFLKNHTEAYDAHGLSAADVGLEKVDNFATASFADVLQGRNDMHLRPQELKTIIEHYGFNADEFLEAKSMPVAQFGNTNFIPPNIDGSFEGFGGVIETAGMCLESDNSITYLWNRMDGRTRGLYFSVLTDSNDGSKVKLTYTGYKYTHGRFTAEGATVDRIAQGSGSECILVGDSVNDVYYVGLTNGSLDPSKHVYSKINLRILVDTVFTNHAAHLVKDIFHMVSVALMGEWIYIILSTRNPGPQPDIVDLYANITHKHFFRVPIASVQATVNVTPVRQNISFKDTDGVQWNNNPWFRWYNTVVNASGHVTKAHFPYAPYVSNAFVGLYRSLLTIVAKNPNLPNSWAVKFLGAHYSAYVSDVLTKSHDQVLEVNYDFDPYTGVFTLKSTTPQYTIDFGKAYENIAPLGWESVHKFRTLVYFYQSQGLNILEDGRIVSSGGFGYSGFPRGAVIEKIATSNSRFATVNKFWANAKDNEMIAPTWDGQIRETLVSPIESGINPRAMLYSPGGEFYISGSKDRATRLGLFFKTVSGKFASRPEIQNLFVGNIVSRPLTNNVRRVNAYPGLGGATVVVPSNKLDTYGVDVGESQFCVNAQKKSFDRELEGDAWPTGVAAGDVVLIQQHTRRIDPDGSITIVPTLEVIYKQETIETFKAQVEFPTIAARGRACIVTICDPTYSNLATKFGWLPVMVSIQYSDAENTAEATTLFTTFMVIQPTYAWVGGRWMATGFTLINKYHARRPSSALNVLRIFGSKIGDETPQTTFGPMRVQYYLNGNGLTVYFGCGVMGQMQGDAYGMDFICTFNDRNASHAWSDAYPSEHTSRGGGSTMTPDNGIRFLQPWDTTTGGAATLSEGVVNNPLLGSVYPEVGWVIFFKTDINVVFNGELYVLPLGSIDLRDVTSTPQNKTFYIYTVLDEGVPRYDISTEKRLETNYQLWVGTVTTNNQQILTIERFNVFALDGHRISEAKRGNSIPASYGLVNQEGQIPWLRTREILP